MRWFNVIYEMWSLVMVPTNSWASGESVFTQCSIKTILLNMKLLQANFYTFSDWKMVCSAASNGHVGSSTVWSSPSFRAWWWPDRAGHSSSVWSSPSLRAKTAVKKTAGCPFSHLILSLIILLLWTDEHYLLSQSLSLVCSGWVVHDGSMAESRVYPS